MVASSFLRKLGKSDLDFRTEDGEIQRNIILQDLPGVILDVLI